MIEKNKITIQEQNDKKNVDEYYHGSKNYFDKEKNLYVNKIFSGEFYINTHPNEVIITILGSCIAACIRDPLIKIGGMNHFLLPGSTSVTDQSTRYGVFAMEKLINEILKKGGDKSRLEIKFFGGGNVIDTKTLIGTKNIDFVHKFIKDEGYKIASEDMGGDYPRKIHYYPSTGKVMMLNISKKINKEVIEEEKMFESSLVKKPAEGSAELF